MHPVSTKGFAEEPFLGLPRVEPYISSVPAAKGRYLIGLRAARIYSTWLCLAHPNLKDDAATPQGAYSLSEFQKTGLSFSWFQRTARKRRTWPGFSASDSRFQYVLFEGEPAATVAWLA